MKYLVQYTLPYEHRVVVGIEAESGKAAIAIAETLFNEGDIWQDSAERPLLFDDYEETGEYPLIFTVVQELDADAPWPEADSSVHQLRRCEAAFTAAKLLVEAYRRGEERGGGIDWDDLDQAYEAALKAV